MVQNEINSYVVLFFGINGLEVGGCSLLGNLVHHTKCWKLGIRFGLPYHSFSVMIVSRSIGSFIKSWYDMFLRNRSVFKRLHRHKSVQLQ